MVLISNGKSTRAGGYLDRTVAQLARAGVQTAVWDGIMENPVREAIMAGAAFARENGCDFIAALGGGAVLDSAVAIAAMATNDGDLWDYIAGGTGRGKPFAHKGLPIVTIATTAGHGLGDQLLGRDLQPGNQGKNRLRRPVAHPGPRRGRPRADADRAAQVHGLSGL